MARLTQQQVEDWIAKNGGQNGLQYGVEQKQVRNPDLTSPDPYTSVEVEVWKNPKTGATLTVRRGDGGDFEQVENIGPKPSTEDSKGPPGGKDYIDEDGPNGRRLGWNPATQSYNRDLGSSPSAQAAATAKRETRVNPNDTTKIQEFNPSTGQWVDAGANDAEVQRRDKEARDKAEKDKAEARAEAERNKPKPVEAAPGKWGYFDNSSSPPKWVPIQGTPEEAAKPVQVNGRWGIWKPGTAGAAPTFETVEVPEARATSKNMEAWEPDFTQPDLGLGAWAARQRQKIGLPADQGGITQQEYDAGVKAEHDRGSITVNNVIGAQNVVRQQSLDEEARRKGLSDSASSDFNLALGALKDVVKGADPDSGSLKNVIPGLMGEMSRYRQEREGQAKPLPGLHPMFQIASAQSAATAQPPAAKEQAAGTGPSPAPYQPPTPPNALGLGAIGSMPAPGGPPPPPMAAQAAPAVPSPPPGAAMPPPSAAMVDGPGRVVNQYPPAPSDAQAAANAGPVPGQDATQWQPPMPPPPAMGQPGYQDQAPLWNPAPPYAEAIQQEIGQPGDPQTAPSFVPPSPNPMPPDTGGGAGGNVQMAPGPMNAMAQQAQTPMPEFDPYSTAAKLAKMGVPPDILAQVVAQHEQRYRGMRPVGVA